MLLKIKESTAKNSKVLLQNDIDNMKKDIHISSYVVCLDFLIYFFFSAMELWKRGIFLIEINYGKGHKGSIRNGLNSLVPLIYHKLKIFTN